MPELDWPVKLVYLPGRSFLSAYKHKHSLRRESAIVSATVCTLCKFALRKDPDQAPECLLHTKCNLSEQARQPQNPRQIAGEVASPNPK